MKMKKCLFLIPTSYNDGSEVAPEVMDGILSELEVAFDGHSIDGVTKGAWRMKDGTLAKDESLSIWIVLGAERVDELKRLVRKFAKVLKQEAEILYFVYPTNAIL